MSYIAIFYLLHSVHLAIKIGNSISNLYDPHRSLHIISKSYIYIIVIHLQLKWHLAYIFHSCATNNRNISTWYRSWICCGDIPCGCHYGNSDWSSNCKEQTLPTLHWGACRVSCTVITKLHLHWQQSLEEQHEPAVPSGDSFYLLPR